MKISSIILCLLLVLVVTFGLTYLDGKDNSVIYIPADSYYLIEFLEDGSYSVTPGDKDLRLYEITNLLSLYNKNNFNLSKNIDYNYSLNYKYPCIITDFFAYPDELKFGPKAGQFIGFEYYFKLITGRMHEYKPEYYTPFRQLTIIVDYNELYMTEENVGFAAMLSGFLSQFQAYFGNLKFK